MKKVVKALGLAVAKGSVNSSSMMYVYQVKQPEKLAERLAKKSVK